MIPVADRVRAAPPASFVSDDAGADLRAPLLVGAIGHRDLREPDLPLLTERFRAFLRRLRTLVPHTPIVLLTGLAEGADSLCAEVALSEGLALVACLPFPVERYRTDFSGPALERFERLAAAALEVRVVRGDDGYLDAGRYVAHYAQLLVALWDGSDDHKPAGTADIVRFRRNGSLFASPEALLMGAADSGSVYQIVTPRVSHPDVPEAGAERWLVAEVPGLPAGRVEHSERRVLRLIDRFNADIGKAPPATSEPSLVDRLKASSDARAVHFQRYTVIAGRALFVFAFVSAMAVTVAEHPFGATNAALIKVAGIAVALALYFIARRSDIQNRYQDYRALAEGLRVQSAWNAFALPEAAYRNYLRMQLGDLRWIRDVLRVTYFRDPAGIVSAQNPWLTEQRDYYKRARAENQRDSRNFNRLALATSAVGFVAGALLLIGAAFKLPFMDATFLASGSKTLDYTYLLSSLVTGTVVIATLLLGYAEFRGYSESAHRYDRMHRLFTLAAASADGADSAMRAGLVLEVGREALAEHAQWLLLRRQRPLDVRAPA
jgi:hypothetical protein